MTFYASLPLTAFSAPVTRPTLSLFVSPSNIFLHYLYMQHFPSIIPVVTRCSSFSLLITWPKMGAWHLCTLFMGDLVSASRNTVSFDVFAVHEIRSIYERSNHISVASNFFCTRFEIIKASKSIQQNGFNKGLRGSSSCVN